jgi:TonB family protein
MSPMNRLQKKCVIATAGAHLLLLTLLVVGPAFYNPRPKPDQAPVLDVIPANLIDAALNSGVRHAAPPPPTPQPLLAPPPQTSLLPPPPLPKPTAPPPPEPKPSFTERVEKFFKPEPRPELAKPEIRPAEPRPERTEHKIQPNLTPVIRNAPANSRANARPERSRDNERALYNAIQALKKNLAPAMTVDMPGDSTVAYANYAAIVRSVYEHAWIPPDTAREDADVKARVTIARDGTVISARILEPSGDPATDDSVQRTLDRVKVIAPFPDDSTDQERTYVIHFNLKAKRMME